MDAPLYLSSVSPSQLSPKWVDGGIEARSVEKLTNTSEARLHSSAVPHDNVANIFRERAGKILGSKARNVVTIK